MISSTKKSFRKRFQELPPEVQQLARKKFKLWLNDPRHPSIHFKKIGKFWSARVGPNYRALALIKVSVPNGSGSAHMMNMSCSFGR